MLSGYDFSICDIPVRLNHIYIFFCLWKFWRGCEGSPKNSLISNNRKLFWEERQCSEEEATQSKCNNDWIRSKFLFHSEVLLENCGKLQKTKRKKNNNNITNRKNLQETKTRWWFSVRRLSLVCLIREAQTGVGASLCCAPGTRRWGQPVQPVQQTTAAARANRGYGEHRGTNLSRKRDSERDRVSVCGVMWQQNLCRRRRKKKWLWQNILKALLGDDWLIAPSPVSCHRHRQQVHFARLYDNIYIVTNCRSTGKEETRHRLEGASHL